MDRELRIVLVEDHAVVRRGLAMLMSAEPDLTVVAEVADGVAAVEAARLHRPDVVVMDAGLPRLDGVSAAERVLLVSPATRIVVLTGSENPVTFEAALAARVHGYVPKMVPPSELVDAIRAVARGERFLHAPTSRPARVEADGLLPPTSLTSREMEVLQLMATTHTYHDIAVQLVVSEETVRSHVKSVLHKLRQPDRTQAVVAAVRAGLLRLS